MNRLMQARVALAAIGIVIWGSGTAVDNPTLRLVGMAFLALSLVLRFAPKKRPPDPDDAA